MIWAFGDCHTAHCYRDVPGVARWTLGYTMRRISWDQEPLFPAALRKRVLCSHDWALAGWGELDVRYRMRAAVEVDGLAAVCRRLVGAYMARLSALVPGRVAVGGIIPPSPRSSVNAMHIPSDVSDVERRRFTLALNSELAESCCSRGWPFVDLYAAYAGPDGFLAAGYSDDMSLHAATSGPGRAALEVAGLLWPGGA